MTASYPSAWLGMSDRLIAGMVHALNNRITALDATVVTWEPGDDAAELVASLRSELERLKSTVSLLRLVGGEPNAASEAVDVRELVDSAVLLVSHHPAHRHVSAVTTVAESAMPVRLRARRAIHALAVLIDVAQIEGGVIAVDISGDAEHTTVRVPAGSEEGIETAVAAAHAIIASEFGSATREQDHLALALPTLAAVRKRERA